MDAHFHCTRTAAYNLRFYSINQSTCTCKLKHNITLKSDLKQAQFITVTNVITGTIYHTCRFDWITVTPQYNILLVQKGS